MCWKVPEQQKSCCISDRMSDWISNQISDMVFWGTSMTEMVQTVDQKGDFKLHQSVSQLIWRLALQEMLAHLKQWKSSLRAGQEMGCGESQFAAQEVKVSQKCSHRGTAIFNRRCTERQFLKYFSTFFWGRCTALVTVGGGRRVRKFLSWRN